MRKTAALMLEVLMFLSVLAGCAEDNVQQADNMGANQNNEQNASADAPPVQSDQNNGEPDNIEPADTSDDADESGIPELIKPWEKEPLNGSYISLEAEAICTVAEAYLARKMWLQYDCSRIMADLSGVKKVTRPQYHTNSPEDCTSQNSGYTNCSAFTYDVYWEAFGLDIKASGTNALRDAVDMHVFTYYITGKETDYERRLVEQNFLNSLQQGDIITCDHPSPEGGHALIYIGDGMMIDSAYFSSQGGGNYSHSSNKDLIEKQGSVRYREVMSFFDVDNYYYFWDEASWAIVRPLKKYTTASVTSKTLNRINNLKNIYVEKLSSHALGQSVDIGEEITYSFYIRNDRDTGATLQVQAAVPENTVYVSGGDSVQGNTLKWTVSLEAKKDTTVEYTVRVKDEPALYGSYILGDGSIVGGVDIKCRNIYVAKHLSKDQENALLSQIYSVGTVTKTGTELAEELYKAAGIKIELPSAADMLDSLFVKYKDSAKHYALNTQSEYIELVAPSMYGGYYCTTSELFAKDRTYGIFGNQIYVGDILLARENGKVYSYMCAGDNKLLDLDTGKLLFNNEARDKLLSLLGRDVFAAIRLGAGM